MTDCLQKKMMKRLRCCKSSRHLPEEMILEILSRLSAKSLCRFQCVSRLWRSMIQSPLVVSAHWARSSANPKLLLCLDNGVDGHIFSTAYPIPSPENKAEDTGSCWCNHGRKPSYVLASEAGLICSYDSKEKEIHVANPITGERITSRTLPHGLDQRNGEWATVVCFGYDPVENKHKVLVLRSELQSGETISTSTVDIFTVGGAEAWRRIINPTGLARIIYFSNLPRKRMRMKSICIDGTIYIIGVDTEFKSWLVAFDVRMETFRAVPVPAEAGSCLSVCLLSFGGAPAFIKKPNRFLHKGELKFKLWILDDFCRQLWSCRKFHVPFFSFSSPVQFAGITSHGEVILYHIFQGSTINLLNLYFYRLENFTVKTIKIPGYRLNAGYRLDDLAAFYHIENMQQLRDLVPTSTTGTEVLYFNNESSLRLC